MQMTLLMPMLVAAKATPCALRVVAGAAGDNAFAGFFRGELADFVVGTAYLKAAGYLQVFCFQIQVVAFA